MRKLLIPLFIFGSSLFLAGCGTWGTGACGGGCGATYVAAAPVSTCCTTCTTCGSYGYSNGWY